MMKKLESDEERKSRINRLIEACESRGLDYAKSFISRNKSGVEHHIVRNWIDTKTKEANAISQARQFELDELTRRNVNAAELSAEASKSAVIEATKANEISLKALQIAEGANDLSVKANSLSSESNTYALESRKISSRSNLYAFIALVISVISILVQYFIRD